jgi:acetyl-CoA C-acetyltransferase
VLKNTTFQEAQDRFAIARSSAQKANKEGWLPWETTPLAIKAGKEGKVVETDEQPFKANLEKIPTLSPRSGKDGTVTAANSSSISGTAAAALVMMRRSTAEKRGLAPLAVVVGHATHAQAPAEFTTAPVGLQSRICLSGPDGCKTRRSLRDQRSLRGGYHGGDAGSMACRTRK